MLLCNSTAVLISLGFMTLRVWQSEIVAKRGGGGGGVRGAETRTVLIMLGFIILRLARDSIIFFCHFRNICLSLRPGTNPDNLLLLWRHECEWVYGERLVSPVDFDRYTLAFVTAARKEFTAEEPVRLLNFRILSYNAQIHYILQSPT